jgi:hypothetical protein
LFAPTNGNYKGVRTFALEVKHVATANFVFYSAILGQALPAGMSLAGATNGADDIQTKDQILKYLRDSFALASQSSCDAHGAERRDSPRQVACAVYEYTAGGLELRPRVGSLWANGGVSACERNRSARKQRPAAGESAQ